MPGIFNVIMRFVKEEAKQKGTELSLDTFQKWNKIILEEEEHFTRLKIRKIIGQEYELEKLGPVLKQVKLYEQDNKKQLKVQLAKKNNNNYIWITINPKPEIKLKDFQKLLKKIVLKTCFTEYLSVLEQRGDTVQTLGKGFHAHILFKRNLNYKPTKCITNLKGSLKKVVGDVNNQHQFNYKIIGTEFAIDKKNYIIGQNKTGENKDMKQNMDIIWRKKNSIDEYLGNLNIV